jgi:nucleotide-binding universal stress UspA family protein
VDLAKEWKADLIVLGSHGRRGMDRILMGSVSENVAIHAHCSVEVVRA